MNSVRLNSRQILQTHDSLRNDENEFFSYFRMSSLSFDDQLALTKQDAILLTLSIPSGEQFGRC